jgi:hypothetical protein
MEALVYVFGLKVQDREQRFAADRVICQPVVGFWPFLDEDCKRRPLRPFARLWSGRDRWIGASAGAGAMDGDHRGSPGFFCKIDMNIEKLTDDVDIRRGMT